MRGGLSQEDIISFGFYSAMSMSARDDVAGAS